MSSKFAYRGIARYLMKNSPETYEAFRIQYKRLKKQQQEESRQSPLERMAGEEDIHIDGKGYN